MTRERFAEEFKSEAVRQVVERGYTVADVAKRLGVSAQSLYKWGAHQVHRIKRMTKLNWLKYDVRTCVYVQNLRVHRKNGIS